MTPHRLPRTLGLFDVYAISTGAMISSGLFLLPGFAAAGTGPSVVLAYLVAGIFILPAMLSVAELSTAMPKAGGAYYFLDRALGPLFGSIGGLGAWVALMLKSAFALVGMGAYLGLVADLPVELVAIALTVLFAVMNVVGAKESAALQRVLVMVLVVLLAWFVVAGLATTEGDRVGEGALFTNGLAGFMSTVGLVFVSYAGLTKVASVAEEVHRPERNIPLGMVLALVTAALAYGGGVLVLVSLIEPGVFHVDPTPVATAAPAVFPWLPASYAVLAVVVAAVAAFASTGNAGILAASRFPLAMARDRSLPGVLARIGRFGTPTPAIVSTAAGMVLAILVLDIEGLAKMASAFILMLFALLNVAVIVMRESGLAAYDPGFRAPLYPWAQIFGALTPFWLIAEMGEAAVLFTLGATALCIVWFFLYGRGSARGSGALPHALARLAADPSDHIKDELRAVVKEQALRPSDPFEEVVARATVLDLRISARWPEVVRVAAGLLARRTGVDAAELMRGFRRAEERGLPVASGVALPHLRLEEAERSELVVLRSPDGVPVPTTEGQSRTQLVHAILFVASPKGATGPHLRLMGQLASHATDPGFMPRWLAADSHQALKETLLRDDHFLSIRLDRAGRGSALVGSTIAEASLPGGSLIALVQRNGVVVVPNGATVLEHGDRVTVIGTPDGVDELSRRLDAERARDDGLVGVR